MTTQENYKDEWLDRAFRLAFFLHGDRETAKQIALAAMNKLETASTAQFKRLYYTPTGRSASKAVRNRVSLGDLQLLQRLVLVESEIHERRREEEGKICERSLLTFFIKHLVRISLKRNSFYVTLAISRILHNYGTADAMEIYNLVIQDPERVHDDYYYRSRKGILMKELKARFGDFLETVRANRGEERFSRRIDEHDLVETANKCLATLTPWNSACAIPDKFDPFADVIKPFHFDKNDPDEEHRTELNRIHAALHPDCFGRLTQALDLSSPRDAMEIPKFMITQNHTSTDNDHWNDPPSLDQDELRQIKEILSAQAASRRAANAGFLRVVADGSHIGQIEAAVAPGKFELEDGTELIEVYAEDGTLLATHLLNFGDLRKGSLSHAITLEGGQKLSFSTDPTLDEFGEVARVGLSISYEETSWQKRFLAAVNNFLAVSILKPALSLGVVLLAIVAGWLLLRDSEAVLRTERKADQPQNSYANNVPQSSPANSEQFVANGRNEEVNGPRKEELKRPEMANASKPNRRFEKDELPKLKAPIPPSQQIANQSPPVRKDEIDEDGILRLPMRENNQQLPKDFQRGREVRSGGRPLIGKSLAEVRYVYIEPTGDQVLGKEVAERVATSLSQLTNLSVTSDKEVADAALKLYVRHESDVEDPDEKTVTVIVRLVNAEGFVIYPNRRRVTGWKYVGPIGKLPSRIAADLTRAKTPR